MADGRQNKGCTSKTASKRIASKHWRNCYDACNQIADGNGFHQFAFVNSTHAWRKPRGCHHLHGRFSGTRQWHHYNAPVFNVAAFAIMPFTTILGGPSGGVGDADLYVVTWSGQSFNSIGAWTAQAQVSVDGGAFFPLDPVGPNIMHTGATQETNTMTWCRRLVAANSAVFRIVWGKIGGGVVTVDNYLTKVERSN